MKSKSKGLIIIFLFFITSTIAMAAELKGTVVNVSNLDVTVKVEGNVMPVAGDRMEISFTLPDGESLSIGTWVITQLNENMAVGVVKQNTGNPVIGHKAVIFSANPVPIMTAPKVEPQSSNNTYQSKTAGAPNDLQQVIESMRSSNPVQKRDAAKIAFRRFNGNAEVMAVAAEELEKGYMINLRDRIHVDAMAWLCNILGSSYDQKYAPLLRKVYKESESEKISDYAKKNWKKIK
jgi:hypothetical protein